MAYEEIKGSPKNIYVRVLENGNYEVIGWINEKQKYGVLVKRSEINYIFSALVTVSNSMYRYEMNGDFIPSGDAQRPNYPIWYI